MITEKLAKDECPHADELLNALDTDVLFTEEPSQFLMVKRICYEHYELQTVSLYE